MPTVLGRWQNIALLKNCWSVRAGERLFDSARRAGAAWPSDQGQPLRKTLRSWAEDWKFAAEWGCRSVGLGTSSILAATVIRALAVISGREVAITHFRRR